MEVKNHISKEFILSKISEEDIFRRYTELEVIGKKFKSPFNNERTPSCIVYSNMFFNVKLYTGTPKPDLAEAVQKEDSW